MRLAAYLRVSTQQQAEEDRFGLARQQHDIGKFIERSGHDLVGEFVEIASGTHGIAGRTAFPDLLTALHDGVIEGLVISDMTRLSRALTTQEALLAAVWSYGGRVFTSEGVEVAQDDPDDPMRTAMRQMAGVFSQLERSMISKRLRDGRKAKARTVANYAWTFAPAGFEKVGAGLVVLHDDPIWQAQRRAQELRDTGMTLREVASVLNTEGFATPSGMTGNWSSMQVSRLLTKTAQPMYEKAASR